MSSRDDHDDTLRAIVAADRLSALDSVDGEDLLHRRLAVFYGYFALLAVLASIATRLRKFPAELDPRALTFILNVQTAHALVLGIVFVALRFRSQLRLRSGEAFSRALDLLATAATAVTAAVALSSVPRVTAADVSSVSFFVLFFVVRAALIPGKPWIAASIAGASAIPFMFGLAAMYERTAPNTNEATAATYAAFRSIVAGVAGVFVVSKTIYGLRTAVEKAVQLGQYVVHEKIGEGGMGVVYRASHAMLKRPTAIKVIPPHRVATTTTLRFEREAMAASRLTHPNNVAIYDFGRTRGGVFYYAMELLDGEDLSRLVEREGEQSAERTRHILRQIAAALAEAHDVGLVHRDVKPENVMLCTRAGGSVRDFVKVLDFGLVKDLLASANVNDDVKITGERSLAGTPLYMSPEAILAPETVGPAADIYGVGGVAYFLLTGRAPFDGNNLVEICAAHVHNIPDPPSSFAANTAKDLDVLILRCLDKNPLARPTARDLVAFL